MSSPALKRYAVWTYRTWWTEWETFDTDDEAMMCYASILDLGGKAAIVERQVVMEEDA
jgi:hypothetical protein